MLFNKLAWKVLTAKDLQRLCCKHKSGALGKTRESPGTKFRAKTSMKNSVWPQCPTRVHLVNPQTVDLLVKNVSDDLRNEKAVIFEASPGAGHVTKALLENGATRVRVFIDDEESTSHFIPNLKANELEAKYPQNLEICFSDILNINRIVVEDMQKSSSKQLNFFADIDVHAWNESPPIKLIAPLSPAYECNFLRPLFHQIVFMTGLFTCGRTEVFAFVSDYEYYYISGSPKSKNLSRYTDVSVLYNTLFNVEHIAEVPYSHFEPEFDCRQQAKVKKNSSICHLVKLSPRVELTERFPTSLLPDYLFFIRQVMAKRTANVINYFEKWIPGCGPRLIKFGVPLFTRFGDLSAHQIFDIFCEFTTWEEFETLNMKTIAEAHEE